MINIVAKNQRGIIDLCRKYGVKRLDLFGSAAAETAFSPDSDIDFFFEFDANSVGLADRYFGLIEDLQTLLHHNVDMVSIPDARNPYFLRVANQHRTTLYAA